MNEHPCDWNEAAQWLTAGELEACSTMPPHERWYFLHPTQGLLNVSAGLQSYRRKPPEPRVPMEFWAVPYACREQHKGRAGFNLGAKYKTQKDAEEQNEIDVVCFREVIELPPLTDEEWEQVAESVTTEQNAITWKNCHKEIKDSWIGYCKATYEALKKLGRAL